MKKVLFMTKNLEMGGVSKALINIIKYIDLEKYDVTVISLLDKNDYGDCFDKRIKTKVIFKKNKFFKIIDKIEGRLLKHLSGKYLYKLFIHEKYDVEIGFITNYPNKIIANSTNKKSKKIGWIHGNYNYLNYDLEIYKSILEQRRTYSKFDTIVCVADECRKSFENIVIKGKAITVYNPIDSEEIKRLSHEGVIESEKQFTICSVGRLSEEKGFLRLLKIHKKLMEDGYKYILWIIGDGPQREILELYIKENNLNNSVKILGYQKNPYKYMDKCDLYVCPSYTEALSTTVQEFLILEKPIITTRCSGMKELLGESEYGIITENSEEALYEGIKEVLENRNIIKYYKNKSKERSLDFKKEKFIFQVENLLS